jgi:hypothetical protein
VSTKRLILEDPVVKFEASWNGSHATGLLTAWRKKRDGTFEETHIRFEDLNYSELACIGRSARVALEEMQSNAVDRTNWALNRILGD